MPPKRIAIVVSFSPVQGQTAKESYDALIAVSHSYEIAKTYFIDDGVDRARRVRKQIIQDATIFSTVAVTSISQFQLSGKELISFLLRLHRLNIAILSINEPEISTPATIATLCCLEQAEMSLKRQKLKKGMAIRKLINGNGTSGLGRPSVINEEVVSRVLQLHHEKNLSLRAIARECGGGIGKTTVANIISGKAKVSRNPFPITFSNGGNK